MMKEAIMKDQLSDKDIKCTVKWSNIKSTIHTLEYQPLIIAK